MVAEQVKQQVSGLQSSFDSLKLFMFLVNPKTQNKSFQDYLDAGNKVPENFREMLYGLAQTAEMFGFNADIGGDVTEMIDDLSPQMMVDILKKLDKETFTKTLKDNPNLNKIITGIAGPVIAQELPTMKLAEASNLIGITIEWGDDLGDLTLQQAQEPANVTEAVSEMDNKETLAFLNSLPKQLQAEIRKGLTAGTEGLDISQMSLKDAIKARAEYGEGKSISTLWGVFNDASETGESSINAVYDSIRQQLPDHISKELKTRLASMNGEQGGSAPKIPPEKLYDALQEKIKDGSLVNILSQNGKMQEIKEQLKGLDDHAFLMQLLPQEIQDEAIFNKLREGLNQFGLMNPIGGIAMQLASFVLNLVKDFAPGLIGQDQTNSIVSTLQSYVDPTIIIPQTPKPPPSEPAVTATTAPQTRRG